MNRCCTRASSTEISLVRKLCETLTRGADTVKARVADKVRRPNRRAKIQPGVAEA